MDEIISQNDENIRKIEDIIDIQKANGNYYMRQVYFNLPSETESSVSANIAKSLESGLIATKPSVMEKNKVKKSKGKRQKSPLSDVFSWPSDSDITVLRMKLCLTKNDLKNSVDCVSLGDGLHQPDSSSMVNLATLVNQAPSKQSLNIEEYLVPLTSWERGLEENTELQPAIIEEQLTHKKVDFNPHVDEFGTGICSYQMLHDKQIYNDSEYRPMASRKAKFARFLRLYFCPCCTCLYKMENFIVDDMKKEKDII